MMNEAQSIHGHPSKEWNASLQSIGVRCLWFIGGWVRSINLTISRKWYCDDVKLTDEEWTELVESFKQFQPMAREILITDILGDLFQFLNNHPGPVCLAPHTLCSE